MRYFTYFSLLYICFHVVVVNEGYMMQSFKSGLPWWPYLFSISSSNIRKVDVRYVKFPADRWTAVATYFGWVAAAVMNIFKGTLKLKLAMFHV